MMAVQVGIALGTNLGERRENLQRGLDWLRTISQGEKLLVSRWLETEPVDCPPGSGLFLNAVAEINWIGTPLELLEKLQSFELEMGRAKVRSVNAPRPLDLDILYFGDLIVRDPGLLVPHPRLVRRRFVLQPLADIRPDLILPGQRKTVRELRDALG